MRISGPLNVEQWRDAKLPEPKPLLGKWLTTTTRAMIVGPTGSGKTMLGLAIAYGVASGHGLAHWRGGQPSTVLYIDGEMPSAALQTRIKSEDRRCPGVKDVDFLSTEFVDLKPLNEGGTDQLDEIIKTNGPYSLIILDNIAALTSGELKDEAAMLALEAWSKKLARDDTAQVWLHHTGHEKSRAYGSSRVQWGMDVVAVLEPQRRNGPDFGFTVRFTKSRGRTSENFADFRDSVFSLGHDEYGYETWTSTLVEPKAKQKSTETKKLTPSAEKAFQALRDAIRDHGERVGREDDSPQGVSKADWQRYCIKAGVCARTEDATRMAMKRSIEALTGADLIAETGGLWHEPEHA